MGWPRITRMSFSDKTKESTNDKESVKKQKTIFCSVSHYFGTNRTISIIIGWIAINFRSDIHVLIFGMAHY